MISIWKLFDYDFIVKPLRPDTVYGMAFIALRAVKENLRRAELWFPEKRKPSGKYLRLKITSAIYF